jgi:hypothetical protein
MQSAVTHPAGESSRDRSSGGGLLLSPAFDHLLTTGLFVLACALGVTALSSPAALAGVVVLNLWLFAYPHVGSTYTRLVLDRASVPWHRWLSFALPPVVLAATIGVTALGGIVTLTTVYFVWQTYHYTKQSYGIARAYRRANGGSAAGHDRLTDVVIFSFPLAGLAHRMHQRPSEFYWNPIRLPDVPAPVVAVLGAVAIVSLLAYLVRIVRRGRATGHWFAAETRFVLSHVAITTISYLLVHEITSGWLFINIWHNAQYLLFVYAFHARRFARGTEPDARVLSWVAQRGAGPLRTVLYAGLCLVLGSGFYFFLGRTTDHFQAAWALPVVLVVHHAVNFHHYLVDAVIWKSARRTS